MVEFSHAIVFVSDMARSIAFYRDVLGLPLRFESPEWTEFDTPGSTLALHLADDSVRQVLAELDPSGHMQSGLRRGRHRRLPPGNDRQRRHLFAAARRRRFRGTLAEYADPDGLPFSVVEEPKKS